LRQSQPVERVLRPQLQAEQAHVHVMERCKCDGMTVWNMLGTISDNLDMAGDWESISF